MRTRGERKRREACLGCRVDSAEKSDLGMFQQEACFNMPKHPTGLLHVCPWVLYLLNVCEEARGGLAAHLSERAHLAASAAAFDLAAALLPQPPLLAHLHALVHTRLVAPCAPRLCTPHTAHRMSVLSLVCG